MSTIQIRKGEAVMSWISLPSGSDQPHFHRAFRTDAGHGLAAVDLGANLNVMFDSAETARALAAACTEAAEALDRLDAESAATDPCPVEAVFPDQSLPCLLERGHEPPHKYTPDPCGTCGCLPGDTPCGGCTDPGCPCTEGNPMTGDRANMMSDLAAEIEKQDRLHPAGYPFTRDGVRLGIAAAGDELQEAYEEWRIHKRDLPAGAPALRGELMQAAAVIMRVIRSIDEPEETP